MLSVYPGLRQVSGTRIAAAARGRFAEAATRILGAASAPLAATMSTVVSINRGWQCLGCMPRTSSSRYRAPQLTSAAAYSTLAQLSCRKKISLNGARRKNGKLLPVAVEQD